MISAAVVDRTRREGGRSEARNARLSSGVITIVAQVLVSCFVSLVGKEERWERKRGGGSSKMWVCTVGLEEKA